MEMILDGIALVLMIAGVFFMLVAAIGFVRLPDVFCRLHVTCILDTLGAPLVLVGVSLHLGWTLTSAKLLLAIAFLCLTSPLVGHLLSIAAVDAEHMPESAGGVVVHESLDGEEGP